MHILCGGVPLVLVIRSLLMLLFRFLCACRSSSIWSDDHPFLGAAPSNAPAQQTTKQKTKMQGGRSNEENKGKTMVFRHQIIADGIVCYDGSDKSEAAKAWFACIESVARRIEHLADGRVVESSYATPATPWIQMRRQSKQGGIFER